MKHWLNETLVKRTGVYYRLIIPMPRLVEMQLSTGSRKTFLDIIQSSMVNRAVGHWSAFHTGSNSLFS